MVKICNLIYPEENEKINKEYFEPYTRVYPLHDFQKWSIEATINGHHVLACAPTGAGKSLCAEFAIDFFCKAIAISLSTPKATPLQLGRP